MEPPKGETLSTPPPTPSEANQNGQGEAETPSSQADQSPARSKRARSKSTRYDDFVDPSEITRSKRRTSGTLQDEKESEPLSKRRKQHLSTTADNNTNGEANHQANSTTNSSSEDAPPKTEEKPEVKITVLPPTPLLPSEEVIMCKVCGKGDNDEKLLLCDGCDAGYHTFCVNPPLEEIPSGDWFCQNCASQGKKQKRAVPSIAAEAVPLSEDDKFSIGEKVIVYWKEDSEYYPAFINGKAREKDSYIILFEDNVAHVIKQKYIYRTDEEIVLKHAKPKKKGNEKPAERKKSAPKRKTRSRPTTPTRVSESDPDVDNANMSDTGDTSCCKCGKPDRGEEMLLCDKCDVGWHMSCLDPPLTTIPVGNWYCPTCWPIVSAKKKEHLTSVSKHELRSRHLSSEHATKRREDKLHKESTPKGIKPLIVKISPPAKPNIMDIKPMNADDFVNANPPKQDGETSSTSTEAKPEPEEPVEILAAPTPSNPSVPPAQPKPRTSHNPLDDVKIEKRAVTQGPKSSPSKFWKGALNFEGQLICNMDAYCKADLLPTVNKNEWPKILDGRKVDVLESVPTEYTPVNFLPDKPSASYDQFVQNLEKNLSVCAVTFPKRTLYILPNTVIHEKGLLPNKTSLIGFFHPKVETPPNPLQFLQQIQKQQLAKVAEVKTPSPQESRFMNKVRFSIVGYNLQDKRISNIIKFLTEHGGAEFIESLSPSKVDMIVIHPDKLKSPHDIPNFMLCKLEPKIRFIRGIDYLEQCCKAKAMVTPGPLERLLPGGALVILGTDMMVGVEDCLEKTVQLLEHQKKLHPFFDYGIKLHRMTLNGVQNFSNSTEIARKAQESIQKYLNTKISTVDVSRITEEEESKNPNALIPSEILRSVMKLSYIMAPKYRFTILISKDKKIAQLAAGNAQWYDSLEELEKFFVDQENRPGAKNSNANGKSPIEKRLKEKAEKNSPTIPQIPTSQPQVVPVTSEKPVNASTEATQTISSDPMHIS